MELAVVEPHGVIRRALGLVQDEFVIQAELAFWCAGEIGPHEDLAIDVCAEDSACAGLGLAGNYGGRGDQGKTDLSRSLGG
jgi:hypothetical protein